MVAKTSKERVYKHRLNKIAEEFSKNWLNGKTKVKPSTFIKAKQREFEVEHNVILADNGFNCALLNQFHENVRGIVENYNDACEVVRLLDAWKQAEKMTYG